MGVLQMKRIADKGLLIAACHHIILVNTSAVYLQTPD